MSRPRLPTFVLGTVLVLVTAVIGFWGKRIDVPNGFTTARLSQTKAKMYDATCTFTADFHLDSPFHMGTFAYHSEAIRVEIVETMRTKSRYMVESPTARKGLQLQMANVANRVSGRRIATGVTFAQFVLQ